VLLTPSSRYTVNISKTVRQTPTATALLYRVKLEKVAINDVLLLKAARRDASANCKYLGPRDTSDLTLIVPFTFAIRCHLSPLAP